MQATLKFFRLSENAFAPTRGPGHVAYTVYASEWVEIPAGAAVHVPTDLLLAFPTGCYGRVCGLKQLASNWDLWTFGDVIDDATELPLSILIRNNGHHPYLVTRGQAIGQIICEVAKTPELEEVDG